MIGLGSRQVDEAAFRALVLDGGDLAGEHGVEGVAQVVFGGGSFLSFVGQAVVDGAAVDQVPAVGIDHEHFGGPRESERLPDQLRLVDQDRVRDVPRVGFAGDGLAAVLQVGVDHQEPYAALRVRIADRPVVRQRVAYDRAAVALHDQHDGARVGVVVQFVCVAPVVEQREVVDTRGVPGHAGHHAG